MASMMKSKLNNLSKPHIIMTLIFITLVIAVSLHVTIKYAYIDELAHYHNGTCYILDCTSTPQLCCSTIAGITTCSNCYNIAVTFVMYVSNMTNYTKTDGTTIASSDYCIDHNNHDVSCYYDDRDIFNSLRVFYSYKAYGGIIGMTILSIGLFIMFILLTIGCYHLFCVRPIEIV